VIRDSTERSESEAVVLLKWTTWKRRSIDHVLQPRFDQTAGGRLLRWKRVAAAVDSLWPVTRPREAKICLGPHVADGFIATKQTCLDQPANDVRWKRVAAQGDSTERSENLLGPNVADGFIATKQTCLDQPANDVRWEELPPKVTLRREAKICLGLAVADGFIATKQTCLDQPANDVRNKTCEEPTGDSTERSK